ncbi:MAG: hypothetical protein UV80_C0007G0050 [Candidatus Peregrinibacteria bacterium GW2011_GWF2_43_17]|nr:MAG: hypothetical protein UV80_C0007G0050 [Candidatus Peregrinibacteria bacterium GW2011_GWF2_43_17]HAU39592.1 hypothetical protein [Candidatus Peregrinibacteria bacterium]
MPSQQETLREQPESSPYVDVHPGAKETIKEVIKTPDLAWGLPEPFAKSTGRISRVDSGNLATIMEKHIRYLFARTGLKESRNENALPYDPMCLGSAMRLLQEGGIKVYDDSGTIIPFGDIQKVADQKPLYIQGQGLVLMIFQDLEQRGAPPETASHTTARREATRERTALGASVEMTAVRETILEPQHAEAVATNMISYMLGSNHNDVMGTVGLAGSNKEEIVAAFSSIFANRQTEATVLLTQGDRPSIMISKGRTAYYFEVRTSQANTQYSIVKQGANIRIEEIHRENMVKPVATNTTVEQPGTSVEHATRETLLARYGGLQGAVVALESQNEWNNISRQTYTELARFGQITDTKEAKKYCKDNLDMTCAITKKELERVYALSVEMEYYKEQFGFDFASKTISEAYRMIADRIAKTKSTTAKTTRTSVRTAGETSSSSHKKAPSHHESARYYYKYPKAHNRYGDHGGNHTYPGQHLGRS